MFPFSCKASVGKQRWVNRTIRKRRQRKENTFALLNFYELSRPRRESCYDPQLAAHITLGLVPERKGTFGFEIQVSTPPFTGILSNNTPKIWANIARFSLRIIRHKADEIGEMFLWLSYV
ncbi:hypothetical protein AVEN_80401-1 [Araneus ventricosus]|uniref:Uncharacterized protein n=1 Tax=Araneus ventricosus TaxID=182803 RepID=A0A4Y2K7B7_ARAVE|nr:hypothetical protein AVEN_80401-1 [Araneus ventricosus]